MIAGSMDGWKKLPVAPAPMHLSEQFIKCNTFFTELHQSAAVPDPEDACCASSPAVQQRTLGRIRTIGLGGAVSRPYGLPEQAAWVALALLGAHQADRPVLPDGFRTVCVAGLAPCCWSHAKLQVLPRGLEEAAGVLHGIH